VERRVARAAELEGIDTKLAAKRLNETDKARTLFVRRLYRADSSDPAWYQLVLDSTWCPVESTVELVAAAARRFFDSTVPC
jgi:cytidylate kinase